MSNVTAESIAREFQQIKDEGYNPDIDEFLHHIPKNMRDDVRALIEAANAPEEPAQPEGPVKLSREEARAMFDAMAAAASA